jgi:predicted nucleotidyltransferase/transcriptional regulator with XRE-family HTH domain
MKIDASKLRTLVNSQGLTNAKLAAKAGITRQALYSMLRPGQVVVEVRDRTVQGLAQALRLPDASLLSPDPLLGYKEAVAAEHADLTFRGLGLPTTEPRAMDDLYVPIRVIHRPDQEQDHECQTQHPDDEVEPLEESDKLTVLDCVALHRSVLIRGEPGSGKTTALRHAARACARGGVMEGRNTPLLLRLPELAKALEHNKEITLVRFVVTRTLPNESSVSWDQIERCLVQELTNGTCLVMLDGLDEVGGDNNLSAVLRRFISEFHQNRFVITSRIVGLDAGPWRKLGFSTFEVARWREEDIQEFAQRWYADRPTPGRKPAKKQRDQEAEAFVAEILSHRPLREIASNPLMLTILAALHYANATLPRRRVDLYSKIVEVMLETWEKSKREARPGDPLHGIKLEAREFGWLLARLALGMQRDSRMLRPRWWMNEQTEKFLREQMALEGNCVKEQTDRVIRYLCERAGLLVERGDGVFGFWHRTFQEYFAARGLLLEAEDSGDIIALLRPYLFHPLWEEVVVHVAASLSATRATALLRVILDDPDPAGRFLRRGQLLALRCLVDGTALADRALLDQVFSDGKAIGGSRWLGIPIRTNDLLMQLLVTRYEAKTQQMLREIDEGAKTGLPESDYLTVYLSAHDLPDEPHDYALGTVYRKRLGNRQVKLIRTGWEKRLKDPEAWCREALQTVRDPQKEVESRVLFISLLGDEADSNDRVRSALGELLANDPLELIRAKCAEALENAVSTDQTILQLLMDRLDKDTSDVVRKHCAEALGRVAPDQPKVRVRLEELFTSGTELLRVGAARGLSRLNFASPNQKVLLERFLTTIASPAEPPRVRCACIWTVAALLGNDDAVEVDRTVENCLDGQDPIVSNTALHVLGDAVADGRRKWSLPLVEKIEARLMASPNPCPHFYSDLVRIVAMKEVYGGHRLERLLGDALTPLQDLVRIAFVYGSVARLEQVQESDIDLMIIGDVRLKEVAAALHTTGQTLGRTVNPVLYSAEKFREQYREGNPFLHDVIRKDKIFLKGNRDELTELVADWSSD